MLKEYLKKITEISNRGDAREESYYSTLEDLLKRYADSVGKKNICVTTIPMKTEAGNPDFRVWDGKQHITGYVEAKAPTVEYLDQVETTDQLKRYLHTFPNVILTNFLEFRLYRDGIMTDRVSIARPFVMRELKAVPSVENEEDFFKLLEKFLSFSLPKVHVAKSLALELAKRTRFLRDEVIAEELKKEYDESKSHISGFYNAFRKYLIGGLTKEEFADLYSQTITYGLFAARTRATEEFNRKLAYDYIPRTIGILKDVFRFVSLEDLPQQMEWIIDDIAEVLAVTDVNNILRKYFHEGKGKDPVVHFYETFLAEYDPKTREKRGVYYTPEPVVSYIVRSLNIILKEKFNKPDGLADSNVTVLDPAAGTLTFLAEATKIAVEEFAMKYGKGAIERFIKEHILKNFYAFELMMAPYAIGHLKISFLLNELGFKLQNEDRFKLYLTNTLDMEDLEQTELPGMVALSEESHLAGKVKKVAPILVILGNPPYSGISANMKPWIVNLLKEDVSGLQSYYKADGQPLGEKKLWLQDDYVKFIRFAQWKINKTREGILGFITNHSYLDNPTFRGMRQSLMKSFNEIYIMNLHGNSLKKEKCPDGSKDENVFDIKQGVAIAIFIKKREEKKKCKIHYSEIWGLREEKNKKLLKYDISKTKWETIEPTSPFYFLIPREEKGRKNYEKYVKVTDIFPVCVTGIVTARDEFVVDHNKQSLEAKIRIFVDKTFTDDYIKEFLKGILGRKKVADVENYAWRVSKARQDLQKLDDLKKYYTKILYRPFDFRHIFFHNSIVWRTRKEVMRHMIQDNLGLCIGRAGQVVGQEKPWNIVLVSEYIVDFNLFYRGGELLFPLYLFEINHKKHNSKGRISDSLIMLFEPKRGYETKVPNLSSFLFEHLKKIYKKLLAPEQILYYIYAILYSNLYRIKYAEFLKIDFPRIPFTADYKIFCKTADFGNRLVDLHLLKSKELDPPKAKYQGKGTYKIEKVRYEKEEVYINEKQYFEGIARAVWEYQIGGYRVCEKWLKDRKGRELSSEDIKHYCRIVTSLQKTIEIQKKIDQIYPEVEKSVIEFKK